MKYGILFALCAALSCSKNTSPTGETDSEENTGTKDSSSTVYQTERATTDPIETSPKESETSSSSATGSGTHEDIDTKSSDSDKAATDPETSSENSVHELLYSGTGMLYALEADDTHLYGISMAGIFRAKKDGTGEPELLGSTPSGQLHQNIYLDEKYAYWLLGENVVKLDKSTLESTQLSLEGHAQDYQVLTGDDQYLYISGISCWKIIRMSKSGGEIITSETEVELNGCAVTSLTLDDTSVYCGGGGCNPTMGKVFKAPKEGGEIVELFSLPEADSESVFLTWGPQASGMVVVDQRLYLMSNFHSDTMRTQYLGWVSTNGGEYTRVGEFDYTYQTKNLFWDKQRKALYFIMPGDSSYRGVYKYDLDTGEISSEKKLEYDLIRYPAAEDNDYIYWSKSEDGIYRTMKF